MSGQIKQETAWVFSQQGNVCLILVVFLLIDHLEEVLLDLDLRGRLLHICYLDIVDIGAFKVTSLFDQFDLRQISNEIIQILGKLALPHAYMSDLGVRYFFAVLVHLVVWKNLRVFFFSNLLELLNY